MKFKGIKNYFVVILSVVFMCINMYTQSYAASSSNTKAVPLKQIENIKKERAAIKKKINSLREMEKRESNKLTKNQQQLEKNQLALKKSQAQYNQKKHNISTLEVELSKCLNKYNQKQKDTAERIKHIYMMKHSLILDLLVSTNSISQFLDRIYYQNIIIQSDKAKMNALKTEARNVALLKQRLEREKVELSGVIVDMNRENYNIQKTINKNKSMIEKIQNDKRAYEKSERELARQSEKLESMIAKSTKNSVVVAGKGFILPVHGRISSPFGYRIHPIFKSKIFHTGIDYAVPMRTQVKAANSGKVLYSGWYGGYGKVVIIDHGNCTGKPTTTLYAHLSEPKVSAGQNVSKGQIIALSGSTGYSTGPHLHFEIRINGKPQNPNNYL